MPRPSVRNVERLADEELMTLVEDGETRALEVLYDRHGGAAWSLAHGFASLWRGNALTEATQGRDPVELFRRVAREAFNPTYR